MTSVRSWVWPTAPAGPGFRTQTKLFCMQALWQCLSMPRKPRPLEALNSIVSAVPGTSAETRVALMESDFTAQSPLEGCRSWFLERTLTPRMESEFTAQLPVEGARCLKKSATLCEEGPLHGLRIWGSYSAYLRRRCWARGRTSCVYSPNQTPQAAVLSTWTRFWTVYPLSFCNDWFRNLVNFDEFRRIKIIEKNRQDKIF